MASAVVIGPGRAGLSLASALLSARAFREITLFGRHPHPPDHPVAAAEGLRYVYGLEPLADDVRCVLIAVRDDDVPEVVHALAALGPAPPGCAVFHLSGSLPTDVLEPLYHRGFAAGAFQPLTSLADPDRAASRLAGAWVAVTAAPEALRTAQELAYAMGAEVVAVPAVRRPLFQAATGMMGGVLMPVLFHAADLFEQAGVEPDDVWPALLSLVRGSLDRVEEGGTAGAVSGPIAAGDPDALALHLRALDPEDAHAYALFARETIRMLPSGGFPLDLGVRDAIDEVLERHLQPENTEVGAGD
jgi:predicted short-subunit dehydrogenase-like oxidoreductase (DUF2520 family)